MAFNSAQELSGVYDQSIWAADDGSWIIAKLKNGQTICGPTSRSSFISGVKYVFSGRHTKHPTYGDQFKFETFTQCELVTDAQVMAYLERHLFGKNFGIGLARARRLLTKFGPEGCLRQMKGDPAVVSRVTGITLEQAKGVAAVLVEAERFEQTTLKLVELFRGRGFQQSVIDQAVADMGVNAYEVIKRDPFTLLVREYKSAGFARCDQMYRDLDRPENRLKRQMICLWDHIKKADGSTWVNIKSAIEHLRRLVTSDVQPERAIELGVRAGWFRRRTIDGVDFIATARDGDNEEALVGEISRLCGWR